MELGARGLLVAMLVIGAFAGCDDRGRDPARSPELATWQVDATHTPSETASTFTALVMRVGCNDGETGEVFEPDVVITDDAVVVTFTVESAGSGPQECPANDEVPYEVDLGEPLGRRAVRDGACDDLAAPFAVCADGGLRWGSRGAADRGATIGRVADDLGCTRLVQLDDPLFGTNAAACYVDDRWLAHIHGVPPESMAALLMLTDSRYGDGSGVVDACGAEIVIFGEDWIVVTHEADVDAVVDSTGGTVRTGTSGAPIVSYGPLPC